MTTNGNVFVELGFSASEAERLRVRAALLGALCDALTARALSARDAARVLGVSRARVADVRRGRIDRVDTEALVGMLARVGARVEMRVEGARGA